jgi:hypothetical protein
LPEAIRRKLRSSKPLTDEEQQLADRVLRAATHQLRRKRQRREKGLEAAIEVETPHVYK